MSRFEIRETYTNTTTNTRFGESGWMPAYASSRGDVFRSARSEYGAAVSKMYRDVSHVEIAPPASVPPFPAAPSPASERTTTTWTVEEVGWVFRKRMVYEDARPEYCRDGKPRYRASDYYMREVWVEVREIADIASYALVGDGNEVLGTYDVATGMVTDRGGHEAFTAPSVSDARALMRDYLELKPGQVLRTVESQASREAAYGDAC